MSQEEQIEKELEEKSIERDAFEGDDAIIREEIKEELKEETADAGLLQQDVEPSPPPKKSKKVRSEKQKAAFEKARKARAEKIALKKKQKEEDKIKKKKLKKILYPLQDKYLSSSHHNPSPHPRNQRYLPVIKRIVALK